MPHSGRGMWKRVHHQIACARAGMRFLHRRIVGVCFGTLLALGVLGHAGPAGAAAPAWTAYVANVGSNTVTRIATASNTGGTPITVGSAPLGIAITPDGTT